MAIPIFFEVAFATQAFPLAAILAVRGRRPPDPYRRIALWSVFLMVSDVVSRVVALLAGTNLFVNYVSAPIEAFMTLWILSAWQPDGPMRAAYLAAIPIIGAVLATALLLTDFGSIFDAWLGPAMAVIVLIAVLQTLIRRTLLSRDLLTDQDWFWVCLGLSLFWFLNVPLPPFISGYVWSNPDRVLRLLYIRAGLLIIAYCLITKGVLCNRNPLLFSGRS